MKRAHRGLLAALAALALGSSLGNPHTRGQLLLTVSRMAGAGASALRSLQMAAGTRYLDLAYPCEPAADAPPTE